MLTIKDVARELGISVSKFRILEGRGTFPNPKRVRKGALAWRSYDQKDVKELKKLLKKVEAFRRHEIKINPKIDDTIRKEVTRLVNIHRSIHPNRRIIEVVIDVYLDLKEVPKAIEVADIYEVER